MGSKKSIPGVLEDDFVLRFAQAGGPHGNRRSRAGKRNVDRDYRLRDETSDDPRVKL